MTAFDELQGKTLAQICVSNDKTLISFTTIENEQYMLSHFQGCCEQVCVEEIVGELTDLLNSPILLAEESSIDEGEEYSNLEKWTFYKLSTNKGSVTIRWYGTSNGYYSVSVDFTKIGA
jgi:hypothetical protein